MPQRSSRRRAGPAHPDQRDNEVEKLVVPPTPVNLGECLSQDIEVDVDQFAVLRPARPSPARQRALEGRRTTGQIGEASEDPLGPVSGDRPLPADVVDSHASSLTDQVGHVGKGQASAPPDRLDQPPDGFGR